MTNEQLEKELAATKQQVEQLKSSFNATVTMIHSFFAQHTALIQNNTDNIEKLANSLDILFKQIVKAINE